MISYGINSVMSKAAFKKLFSPILQPFEQGNEAYRYQSSHRKILLAVGGLFLFLSAVSVYFAMVSGELGALIPISVFFIGGLICVVIGLLGSDKAVAKIWGSK